MHLITLKAKKIMLVYAPYGIQNMLFILNQTLLDTRMLKSENKSIDSDTKEEVY